MTDFPYQDPQLTIRQRVTDLVSRMSIKEKVGQVNQHLYGWECYEKNENVIELTDRFKEHVKWGGGLGALYGLFRADPWSKVDFNTGIPMRDSWKIVNKIQSYVIEQSRWGIPALIVEECPHGHQALEGVSYPTNIGRGNTFNTELMKETCQLMARELSLKGVHLALVSTLDLVKDPRWGRSEECFGEDPILAAKFSEAVIEGFQGELVSSEQNFLDMTVAEIGKKPYQIGVVLKHCIAQGEALGGHNSGTVTIGNREFSDIYNPLLKSTRNAVGVMAAYNDLDGVPCHINGNLFQKMMREQLGYQGIVMADGIALDRLDDVFSSDLEAAAAALTAGVDLSLWDQTYTKLEDSIQQGLLSEKKLDEAVKRVLAIKFLLGLFDHPYVEDPEDQLEELIVSSQKANLEMAEESLTLLKNNNILPLKNCSQTIAVVGPNANEFYNLLGDYTAPQSQQLKKQTIFQEIKKTFNRSKVFFAKGCEIRNTENQETLIREAVKISREADVIILALGGSSARNFNMEFLKNGAVSSKGINMDSGENVDVASLSLGGQQMSLLRELAKLNKPIISLLIQGRTYDIEEVQQLSEAVLVAWFPGQQGAKAIAHTLKGTNNPSGKLSVSYPRNSGQLPVYYYQRAATKQHDYYDESGTPLYPFGTGMSYSTFEYSELKVEKRIDNLSISVKVKNTGLFAGKESVLLFIKLFGGQVIQRSKLLKSFSKVLLAPGEQTTVVFTLKPEDFVYMDIDYQVKKADKVAVIVNELIQETKI